MTQQNPANQLQSTFTHIATTRMAGLPILNPNIQVEVVGMQAWQGKWLGVLITPWTMSLVLLSGSENLPMLPLDVKANQAFPSGNYDFMAMEEPNLGVCYLCSLSSPMDEFATHADAVLTAKAVLDELMQEAVVPESENKRETQAIPTVSILEQPMSRRGFLRGALLKK